MTRVATGICIWSTNTHTKFSTNIYNFLNLVFSKVDLQLNRLNPMPTESDAHAVCLYAMHRSRAYCAYIWASDSATRRWDLALLEYKM